MWEAIYRYGFRIHGVGAVTAINGADFVGAAAERDRIVATRRKNRLPLFFLLVVLLVITHIRLRKFIQSNRCRKCRRDADLSFIRSNGHEQRLPQSADFWSAK
ncbi:MAG: hypothetical protein H0W47_11450 [Polaromonas sp.]|uniref:hypothetical protein n=1 Tax=Polaromonas sp. TaxID=1869339 RepID=UPI0017B6A8A7|nr:hypothetical protein [Polaromonas sp.]MBA3594397.1 hypothetical protein [Polaromonas sp.]